MLQRRAQLQDSTASENKTPCALPLECCLAKTRTQKCGRVVPGRTVLSHCLIVAAVARGLLQRMPKWLRELFPEGSDLIAALHDIGKCCPTFQEKIYRTISGTPHSLPELVGADPALEHLWGGHAGASQLTARDLNLTELIPEIIGGHHGYPPPVASYDANDAVLGGQPWQQRRAELEQALRSALQTSYPVSITPLQARLLAGLTTVADWIGSGPLFDDPDSHWQPRIDEALDAAGFVRPSIRPGLSFSDIFGGKHPRKSQQRFIEEARQPGLYILEAPMGIGKTEAALYAAYQLLQSGQATGLYFALPTQLTSDKIHARTTRFLQQILAPDSPHTVPLLLHSNAWMKSFELGGEGCPGGAWFDSSKRGTLVFFAVGTIDQALMAVMRVKHGFVRTFGLAGKVVILDEVHSYDSYTGTIVEELVKTLLQLHCTVIILSATLTRQHRAALTGHPVCATAYPLISSLPHNGIFQEHKAEATEKATVHLHFSQEEQAVESVLQRAETGQHVLWIENTVAEAQNIFIRLASRAGALNVECGLLHSRYSKQDRQENETVWTHYFGKEGYASRQQRGRILVGTQVLEQSLDIDADFLISRFAPTDMLLQRIGRLWRHAETPRPATARREAWLLAPAWENALLSQGKAFGTTAVIYSPYVLCRSLEIWMKTNTISLPGHIRPLIEQTYSSREEKDEWLAMLHQLERERETLRRLALLGVSDTMQVQPEHKAATRHADQDHVEVLLVREFCIEPSSGNARIRLPNGDEFSLPKQGGKLSKAQRRKRATELLLHTVRVPEKLAPAPAAKATLSYLEDYLHVGRKVRDELQPRVVKLTDSGLLTSLDGGPAAARYTLRYDHLGYRAEKTT
ncbi:MAG: CRISPR-associated helicase Cas3' [Desulfobulbus sp.]|jgi:CRISPR-associated endonuclease/helicase Cas3